MNDTILLTMPKDQFNQVVEKALKDSLGGHLLALATSPLAQSSLVETSFLSGEAVTSTVRGRAMQSMLRWAIDKLRPNGEHSWIALSFRSYNILYNFYMQGSRVAEIAEKMGIAPARFYGLRPQAIEQLAEFLYQELGAGLMLMQERKQYAISDRYASRPDDEQRLLRMTALLRYPVPITLIQKMSSSTSSEPPNKIKRQNMNIQASIHHLVVAGMLVSDDHAIEILLHPEMSQYLLTLLSPQEREEWHRAAGIYYEEQQQDYLEAAHHFSLTNGWKERAAQLLIDYYQEIVDELQLEELNNLLERFHSAQMSNHLWRRLKLVAGQVAELMADFERALAEYGEALGARQIHIRAEAYYRRAKVFELTKDMSESLAHYTRGIELLEQTNSDDPQLVNMYIDRAWIFIQIWPDLEQATFNLECAQRLILQKNRAEWVALHNAWAKLLHKKREPESAIKHRWNAWLIAQELQDVNLMINMAHNLGQDYYHSGKYEQALKYLKKSKALAIKAGNRKIEGACYSHMGACYFYLEKHKEALLYYQQSYDFFAKSGNRNWQSYACYNLAEVHIKLGNQKEAQRYFHEGVNIAQELQLEQYSEFFDALVHKHPEIFWPRHSLNNRQLQALNFVKEHGKITNREHRELTGAAQKTAVRDLQEMVEKGILAKVGKGRATRYVLAQKEG